MVSVIANKITAFVLVFMLLAHNINTLAIVGDFIINQDFIAKTLCIQKSNQQGCNGKCYLMTALKKNAEESNPALPVKETKRFALDAFCLYRVHFSESPGFTIKHHKIGFGQSAQNLLQTYFDIDTPPPISI